MNPSIHLQKRLNVSGDTTFTQNRGLLTRETISSDDIISGDDPSALLILKIIHCSAILQLYTLAPRKRKSGRDLSRVI
jgi:hypothetical protein